MGKGARLAVVLGALLAGTAPAQAQGAGEFALPPKDGGFVLGWIGPGAPETHEYFPRGETVEDWTRMVTVQRMPWRIGLTPRAMVAMLARMMVSSCPGATATEAESAPLGDRDGAGVRVTCPKNPDTGKPETMFARAIQGDGSIAMIQAAVRRSPTADDLRWSAAVLDGATWCAAADTSPRCAAARSARVGSPL